MPSDDARTVSSVSESVPASARMSFLEAVAFQWVNPEAWAMPLGATTAFVAPSAFVLGVLIVTLVFTMINLPRVPSWAGFGVVLRRFLDRRWTLRPFNVTMALLLVASFYPMFEGLGPQA